MPVELLLCTYSPFRGNRRLSELVEQRLGLFEIGGIEAFGKPAEDWGEQCHRLLRPAPLSPQAGEADRTAQFPGLRVLPTRDVDAFLSGHRRPATTAPPQGRHDRPAKTAGAYQPYRDTIGGISRKRKYFRVRAGEDRLHVRPATPTEARQTLPKRTITLN
jgi:hypothetical protein